MQEQKLVCPWFGGTLDLLIEIDGKAKVGLMSAVINNYDSKVNINVINALAIPNSAITFIGSYYFNCLLDISGFKPLGCYLITCFICN